MPSTVIVGMQWGDEGKAKVLDFLAEDADLIVRYQGGANAGHTVVIGDDRFAFHLVPSGILRTGKVCVIGNGVVLDPEEIIGEIDELATRGVGVKGRLLISNRAHIVMPYHKAVEKAQEEGAGVGKIGTTLRGIGPAYVDKYRRTGVRAMDLLDESILRAKVAEGVKWTIPFVDGDNPALDLEKTVSDYMGYGERLGEFLVDSATFLNAGYAAGKALLFEGAQGTLLDVDFGTYPYVTSSSSSACGVCAGTGISPRHIDRVVGVVKAYTTRVGAGPFPTELLDETGERLRDVGGEFGTTTGRPRRCGWLDAVGLKFAAMLNGVDAIAITKLDVLTGIPVIRIAVAYRIAGKETREFPVGVAALEAAEPVYEEMPGWEEEIGDRTRLEDLPDNARRYVDRIADICGSETALVSVGRNRRETIVAGGECN
ncbi:MAG: adenylosuccinate synthase [Planctomycetes bacterium]|nr:adenylosuccinate synthase [Planctomycetota bacterium]